MSEAIFRLFEGSRGIPEALSLEPATPDEARARLGLKGGDRVAF